MATYKILYWQEIPSQIKAEDDDGERSQSAARIKSFRSGSTNSPPSAACSGSDDYLAQWNWSDEQDRDGSAQEVAEAIKAELEAQAKW